MEMEFNAFYEAVRSRDARFDGRFFTAVLTTGVYCRSICPARTPRPENVRFFSCAAAAEEAGFRPCKRCQPHRAPGTPLWIGSADTVIQAMSLVQDGFLDEHSLEDLAERLNLTSRHVRRLFADHLGTTPVAVAQTRRLHFARNLLQETGLSIIEVAMAAGFRSLRRFNESFLQMYGCPPSLVRKPLTKGPGKGWDLQLRLSFRPPFDGQGLLGFLAARAIPGVEEVSGGEYRRSVGTVEKPGLISVSLDPNRSGVVLRVAGVEPRNLSMVVSRIRKLFDLGAAPDVIAAALGKDPLLAGLLQRRPGVRVPGAWNGFELGIRAILGQQVSVAAATTLAGRLVDLCGTPLSETWNHESVGDMSTRPTHLFPTPRQVAEAPLERLGIPRKRAEALRALARAVFAGNLDLEGDGDPETMRNVLGGLPGVGDWTVEYIAMRALGDPDAFPATDLVVRRTLEGSPREVERAAGAWRPWRAYATLLLWLESGIDAGKGTCR